MSDCCNEPKCKRTQPILIRRAPLSGKLFAITRWERDPNGFIVVKEKHGISIDFDELFEPHSHEEERNANH